MVISSTVEGFVPIDTPTWVTPVQVTGHTVNNLTTARSPQGRALFGWSSGGSFYCAVRDDFEDMFRDDVVPDGDERMVLGGDGIDVLLGSIWVDPREGLFAAVKWTQENLGTSVCYKANNAENPTSWIERGTISSRNIAGSASMEVNSGGPVTILPSGRWVLPFAGWTLFATSKADTSMLAISDDRGIDWNIVVSHRREPLFSGTTGPISNTIGQDPLTGYLYWAHYDGPVANQGFIYESQDGGTSWIRIVSNASRVWNYCIDNATDILYAAADTATSEWEWNQVVTPASEASYVDLDLTVIASRQNIQFQCIPFQSEGAIAYIDTNRIAVQRFESPGCPDPDLLHIPYKDRLLHLTISFDGTPAPASFSLMADRDFDNLKEIERWAQRWVTFLGADSSNGCRLNIPYKDHLHLARDGVLTRAIQRVIAGQSFQNYKTIEWWAARIVSGECACGAPERCRLQIPFKDAIAQIVVDEQGKVDRASLTRAASQDFENYKVIERWAYSYARGECSTGGSQQPWPPKFPPDVLSSARLAGEMIEASTKEDGRSRLAGEVMEVSTKEDGRARLAGEIMEVSTKEDGQARLAGQMMEVAVIL